MTNRKFIRPLALREDGVLSRTKQSTYNHSGYFEVNYLEFSLQFPYSSGFWLWFGGYCFVILFCFCFFLNALGLKKISPSVKGKYKGSTWPCYKIRYKTQHHTLKGIVWIRMCVLLPAPTAWNARLWQFTFPGTRKFAQESTLVSGQARCDWLLALPLPKVNPYPFSRRAVHCVHFNKEQRGLGEAITCLTSNNHEEQPPAPVSEIPLTWACVGEML